MEIHPNVVLKNISASMLREVDLGVTIDCVLEAYCTTPFLRFGLISSQSCQHSKS